jgi:O-methyltransferase domain
MRGTLFDQSAVVDGGRRVLGAAGVSERCEISRGDFFSSVPSGGDAYLLKSIIHDWDDEKSISILRRCRDAMSSTGRLLLFERVVPTADVFSEAKLFDINMLVVLDGLERTEAEYAALLATAGFRLSTVIPSSCALSIIEALPKGAS